MSDALTNPENVTMSAGHDDGITASPRPWRVEVNRFGQSHVLAADDTHVDGPVGPDTDIGAANAALIVDAVNERESLFADMKIKENEMRLKIDAAEKERCEASTMSLRAKEWHSVWLKENEKLRDKLDASEAERNRLRDLVRRFCDLFTPETIHPAGTMERLLREARAAIGEDKQ